MWVQPIITGSVYLGLWKGLYNKISSKKESLQLGFEFRQNFHPLKNQGVVWGGGGGRDKDKTTRQLPEAQSSQTQTQSYRTAGTQIVQYVATLGNRMSINE